MTQGNFAQGSFVSTKRTPSLPSLARENNKSEMFTPRPPRRGEKGFWVQYRSKGLGWLALERVLFLGNKQQYDKAG